MESATPSIISLSQLFITHLRIRSSVYIQNCRMFNLTKNKRTLHLNYTVNFSQFLKNESVIGIQIFQDHLNEKIINTAGRIALHNFIDLLDLLLKALYMFVVVNLSLIHI